MEYEAKEKAQKEKEKGKEKKDEGKEKEGGKKENVEQASTTLIPSAPSTPSHKVYALHRVSAFALVCLLVLI